MSVQLSVNIPVNSVFPGGVLSGQVSVTAHQALNPQVFAVLIQSEIKQHWTTTTRHTTHSGFGKNRRSHTRTVTHHHYNTVHLFKTLVPVGNFVSGATMQGTGSFPFFFQVPADFVPTTNIRDCNIKYHVTPQIDGNAYGATPVPFNVLIPMPVAKWSQPSALNEERKLDLVCCCCCDDGFVNIKFLLSKSVLSLDVDKLFIRSEIDNTKGEEGIKSISAMLYCQGRCKVGHVMSFSHVSAQKTFDANVAAGATGVCEGVLDLTPQHPPTFQSSIVDMTYKLHLTAVVDAVFTSNAGVEFGVTVAQAVDHTESFNPELMNSFVPMNASASPMMAPQFNEMPQPQFAAPPPPVFASMMPPPNFGEEQETEEESN